jgi:hypothetical protein
MKCERARDGVLLADSGELPVTGRLRLFFHLRGCPSCREYADELSRTTRAYRADSAAGVGERVTGAILDFAERERTRGARAAPAPAWRPAFAFAALALLLAAAGVLLLRAPGERKLGAAAPAQGWDDPVDEQIEQVNELWTSRRPRPGTPPTTRRAVTTWTRSHRSCWNWKENRSYERASERSPSDRRTNGRPPHPRRDRGGGTGTGPTGAR